MAATMKNRQLADPQRLTEIAENLAAGRLGPLAAAAEISGLHGLSTSRRAVRAMLQYRESPVAIRVSSDWSAVIGSAASKALIRQALALAPTWPAWAAGVEVTRTKGGTVFHAVPPAKLSSSAEGGAGEHIGSRDSGTGIDLSVLRGQARLSFESIVSDDLGLLTRELAALAFAATSAEEDAAYSALIGGIGSFPVATSNGVPTPQRIDDARNVLASQTNGTGEKLYLPAAVLLVPQKLLGQASVACYEANTASNYPLRVVANSRLDENSVTRWYLLADPAVMPAAAVAFLPGRISQPELTTRLTASGDLELFVRHAVGAAVINSKSCVTNPGA